MAVISEAAIKNLASFRSEGSSVVTCYLDVDGRRHVRPQDYQTEFSQLLRDTRTRLNGSARAGGSDADLDRIEAYVDNGVERSGVRGIVIISCESDGLWEVISLPVSVRNRIVVNETPAVAQLEAIVQDYERLAVLLVDKQRARLFVFELGELVDHSELLDELPRHYDSRGHSDHGYEREQDHTHELISQHVRHAAEACFELYQRKGFAHLVVSAPSSLVTELEGDLHPYIKERLRGRLHVEPAASLAEIKAAALEVEAEVDREREAMVVARLREAVQSGRKGAGGIDDVLVALHEHRAERLVVSAGYAEGGWRCGGCGALARVGRTCRSCGGEMTQVDDVVEDAVEDALTQGVRVDVCVGNADLDVLGRIGAMLRY